MTDLAHDFSMGWDDADTVIEQKAIKRKLKNDQIHFIKANQLAALCKRPKPGEQYRIITEKQFNAYALILHLLETETVDELYMAIFRVNEPTVTSLIDLIETGRIKRATFIISSFFNQTKKPEQWAIMLCEYCKQSDVCDHIYTHTHAKVAAIKTKSGHYVFEGSGNMSDNAMIEQYVYEESEKVFDFHKQWMTELVKKDVNRSADVF